MKDTVEKHKTLQKINQKPKQNQMKNKLSDSFHEFSTKREKNIINKPQMKFYFSRKKYVRKFF
jgi:hypothetical protein